MVALAATEKNLQVKDHLVFVFVDIVVVVVVVAWITGKGKRFVRGGGTVGN